MQLELTANGDGRRTISPYRELGAYEALWQNTKATFKSIAEQFAGLPGSVPSDFVPALEADRNADSVFEKFTNSNLSKFGVRVNGAAEYPTKLRDARYPVELLYYLGWWDLVNSRGVAVVGTREPSGEGQSRTRKLVKAFSTCPADSYAFPKEKRAFNHRGASLTHSSYDAIASIHCCFCWN